MAVAKYRPDSAPKPEIAVSIRHIASFRRAVFLVSVADKGVGTVVELRRHCIIAPDPDPGLSAEEIVLAPAAVRIERKSGNIEMERPLLPVQTAGCPDPRVGVMARPLPGIVLGIFLERIVVPVVAEIGTVAGIEVQEELPSGNGRRGEIEHWMHRIAGTGTQVELVAREIVCLRLHVHQVRREVVASLVGILEHGIVEVQVETQERVRDGHLYCRLRHAETAFVLVGDFHGGVDLRCGRNGDKQSRKYGYVSKFHSVTLPFP